MSTKSGIAWTDATWSPVTGCTKVSAGCKNCYAEREVESRWSKNPKSVFYGQSFTDVRCHQEKLEQPLHWKKPRKIFVCPRGDLFHPDVPDQFIADVFGIMAAASQHTFQVLTKRPERALKLLGAGCMGGFEPAVEECLALYSDKDLVWPLPNVWLGVSVEDQEVADEQIPYLLQTPAAVRWISVEPLLGPVDLTAIMPEFPERFDALAGCLYCDEPHAAGGDEDMPRLDWVVAGGESGPKARPMHPNWARSLRDQCRAAGVPFFFKQWGEWAPWEQLLATYRAITARSTEHVFPDGVKVERFGNRLTGRVLDGYEWNQYPEVTA